MQNTFDVENKKIGPLKTIALMIVWLLLIIADALTVILIIGALIFNTSVGILLLIFTFITNYYLIRRQNKFKVTKIFTLHFITLLIVLTTNFFLSGPKANDSLFGIQPVHNEIHCVHGQPCRTLLR